MNGRAKVFSPTGNVVLVYPVSQDRQRVLMAFHKEAWDPSFHRYNALTAIPVAHESVADAAGRAMSIAGIAGTGLVFRGGVHWHGFTSGPPSLFGHHFLATADEQAGFIVEDDKVRRQWLGIDRLLDGQVPCWPGDAHIFPLLFDADPRPFHGSMGYANGLPDAWHATRA